MSIVWIGLGYGASALALAMSAQAPSEPLAFDCTQSVGFGARIAPKLCTEIERALRSAVGPVRKSQTVASGRQRRVSVQITLLSATALKAKVRLARGGREVTLPDLEYTISDASFDQIGFDHFAAEIVRSVRGQSWFV